MLGRGEFRAQRSCIFGHFWWGEYPLPGHTHPLDIVYFLEGTWYERYSPRGQTDTCENITFQQLRLRPAKITTFLNLRAVIVTRTNQTAGRDFPREHVVLIRTSDTKVCDRTQIR